MEPKIIYTHGGTFHADENMGCAILDEYYGGNIQIIRMKDLSQPTLRGGLVLDTHRIYDHLSGNYDHHHEEILRPNGYPYATSGLIWKHYGLKLCKGNDRVHQLVDEMLIQGIDANDDDSNYYHQAFCSAGEVEVLTYPRIVSSMNPEEGDGDLEFREAMTLSSRILNQTIKKCFSLVEAEDTVRESSLRDSVKDGLKYYVFASYFPWHRAVIGTEASFVVMPSNHPGSPYSVFAVPSKLGRRELRVPIERPSWFKGFIHKGKWIAGCGSIDEARDLIHSQRQPKTHKVNKTLTAQEKRDIVSFLEETGLFEEVVLDTFYNVVRIEYSTSSKSYVKLTQGISLEDISELPTNLERVVQSSKIPLGRFKTSIEFYHHFYSLFSDAYSEATKIKLQQDLKSLLGVTNRPYER